MMHKTNTKSAKQNLCHLQEHLKGIKNRKQIKYDNDSTYNSGDNNFP